MRTRSDARSRRHVFDPRDSEARSGDRVAPPCEARDAPDDGGDVAFVYSRGPYRGIQVTLTDVWSLDDGQEARDDVIDALARYIWQEERASTDVRGCLVFCSVVYKMLRERGPAAVLSMTQSVNVFDYSTWVFFFCERGHWLFGVGHDVPGLARALRMSAAEVTAQTGQPAGTLAFLNSLGSGGVSKYSHVRTTLFGWVRTVAPEMMRDETVTPSARWVSTCLSVVSPSVPQQRATLDCGVYALYFFPSFFKCSVAERCVLVCAGATGKAAWSAAFVRNTREELRAVCNVLEGRHTVAAARQAASRQVVAKRSPGACSSSPMRSAPSMEKEQRDSASSPPSAMTPAAGSAAAVKAGREAGREPSGRGLVVSTSATCVLASARGREGEAAGSHIAAHARGHGAAAGTVTASAREKVAKRRRLSKEDAAAASWLAAFNTWGLKYEPDVARDLIVIFSACDALLPSFITHYATGVAKWCPPANRDALESWFVDVLKTGSGCGRPGDAREGVGGGSPV